MAPGQKAGQAKSQPSTGPITSLSRCPASIEKNTYNKSKALIGTSKTPIGHGFLSKGVCSPKKRDKRDKRDRPCLRQGFERPAAGTAGCPAARTGTGSAEIERNGHGPAVVAHTFEAHLPRFLRIW
jgi:hypothetical protein